MSRYVVTGGAGFIGSAIVRKLVAQKHDVIVIDNLSTGVRDNLVEGSRFEKLDLRDTKGLLDLKIKDVQAVFHLGGQSSGEISHDDPDYDLATNAGGTRTMLEWCLRNNVPRFLNASSMGVYGQVEPSQCPVREDTALRPSSFYGVSKLAGEKFCEIYQAKGLQTTSFRMFNVYGPGQNLTNMKQGMVSIYLAYLLKGQDIEVKGSLGRFRDFVFIDDVVNAWVGAVDAKSTFGRAYNLATNKKTTVGELVEQLLAVARAAGQSCQVKELATGTPGDQHGIFADCSALKRDGHWQPKVGLAEGLTKMFASVYQAPPHA